MRESGREGKRGVKGKEGERSERSEESKGEWKGGEEIGRDGRGKERLRGRVRQCCWGTFLNTTAKIKVR